MAFRWNPFTTTLDVVNGTTAAGSDGQLQYNDGGVFGGTAAIYYDDVNGRLGINTVTPDERLDINGNFQIGDPATKAYRFRQNGSNLDIEGTGADIFLSVFSAAAYGGTQRNYLRIEAGAQLAHAIGTWEFTTTPFAAATATIDGTTGNIRTVGVMSNISTTNTFAEVVQVYRNNTQRGRIDNNANGMRIMALTNLLYLHGTAELGISVDSAGRALFDGEVEIDGALNHDGTTAGFLGNTPIVKQGATVDLGTVLSNFGFRTGGTAYPLTTSGAVAFTGNFRLGFTARSSAFTLTSASSYGSLADATSAAFTLTLPAAAASADLMFCVIKVDGTVNAVTVKGNGAELINNANTYLLSTQYKYVTVACNGTQWFVVGNN